MKKLIEDIYKELEGLQSELGCDLKLSKFGMSNSTLDVFKASVDGAIPVNEFDYCFLGCVIEVNDDIPENKVEVYCEDMLVTTVWVTEYQINNSSEFGTLTMMQSHPKLTSREMHLNVLKTDHNRASGRTFRTCLDVLKTASESNNGNVTFLAARDGNEQRTLWVTLLNLLSGYFDDNEFSCDRGECQITLHGHRFIRIITEKQTQNVDMFRGRQSKIIYEHTVNP